jgi:hypothetical protein
MTALVATGLVASGTLVSTWALILIGTLIQLGTHAAQNTDIRLLARQIAWDDGTTIAAIAIFVATYLVIAIGKLPGYQLDRAGAALLGASLMVGLGIVSSNAGVIDSGDAIGLQQRHAIKSPPRRQLKEIIVYWTNGEAAVLRGEASDRRRRWQDPGRGCRGQSLHRRQLAGDDAYLLR